KLDTAPLVGCPVARDRAVRDGRGAAGNVNAAAGPERAVARDRAGGDGQGAAAATGAGAVDPAALGRAVPCEGAARAGGRPAGVDDAAAVADVVTGIPGRRRVVGDDAVGDRQRPRVPDPRAAAGYIGRSRIRQQVHRVVGDPASPNVQSTVVVDRPI